MGDWQAFFYDERNYLYPPKIDLCELTEACKQVFGQHQARMITARKKNQVSVCV